MEDLLRRCSRGESKACGTLAERKGPQSDRGRRTMELLLRRCAHGQADACRALGTQGGVSDPGF